MFPQPSNTPPLSNWNVLDLELPEGFTSLRPHQVPIIDQIVADFEAGSQVVLLSAPPGAGKTLIAEMVRRSLNNTNMLFLPHTKTLQRQFLADFPNAQLIFGRANYPTLDKPDLFDMGPEFRVTCDDCDMRSVPADCDEEGTRVISRDDDGDPSCVRSICSYCNPVNACPYRVAREAALGASIAVANIQYALGTWQQHESDFSGTFGLVVVDEADTLESVLRGNVEVSISKFMRRKYRIDYPAVLGHEAAGALNSWSSWCSSTINKLTKGMKDCGSDVDGKRTKRTLKSAIARIVQLRHELEDGNWVLDYESTPRGQARKDDSPIVFRPIKVDGLAQEAIWAHGTRFLVMSGTLIPDMFKQALGTPDNTSVIDMPSTFAAANRPLRIVPVASMTHKTEELTKPVMTAAISAICDLHPDERILVHTVSYGRARWLFDRLEEKHGERVQLYTGAGERDQALEDFRKSANGVLLAASLDRGVSLDDEECRYQVITKIAYPSMGDKLVVARMYDPEDGRLWYATEAIRTFIQTYGRTTRSEQDFSSTYVLDAQFLSLTSKFGVLFPQWVKDAFEWGDGEWDRKVLGAAQEAINLRDRQGRE